MHQQFHVNAESTVRNGNNIFLFSAIMLETKEFGPLFTAIVFQH